MAIGSEKGTYSHDLLCIKQKVLHISTYEIILEMITLVVFAINGTTALQTSEVSPRGASNITKEWKHQFICNNCRA